MGYPSCQNTDVSMWAHEEEKPPPSPTFLPASPLSSAQGMLPSPLHARETWIYTRGNGAWPLNSPTQAHKEIPKIGKCGNTTPVLCLSAWKLSTLGPFFPTTLFPSHPPLHKGNLHDHTVPQGMPFLLIPSIPEYLNHPSSSMVSLFLVHSLFPSFDFFLCKSSQPAGVLLSC